MFAQAKGQEPVTTESGSSAPLSGNIKKALGFEDEGNIVSEMVMTSEQMHQKEPWGSPHGEGTGSAIAICNGLNNGHCTEAADVVRHRLRRPGKRAAPGDPDYVDDDPALLIQKSKSNMFAQAKGQEPVTAESGSSAQLSGNVMKALGFEDEGGLVSELLMTDV